MTARAEYEHGRSDGYADGAYDAEWSPDRTHGKLITYMSDCRVAREVGRKVSTRAWLLGFCRGYREAIGIGGRT